MASEATPNDNTSPLPINKEDIETHLQFVAGGEVPTLCGAWFDQKGEKPIPQYGVWYGTVEEVLNTRKNLSEIGYKNPGFHVTLCETSDSGRKEGDIEAPRVLCLDIDNATEDRASVKKFIEGTKVQLAVESSPGKFHFYWAVKKDMTLPEWKVFQAGIAHRFKGDVNLAQLNHIIRVPGFPRLTKSGDLFTPQIVWSGDREELSSAAVAELFFGIVAEGQKALVEIQAQQMAVTRRAMELARASVNGKVGAAKLKEVGASIGEEGSRNNGLFQAVKTYCRQAKGAGVGKAEAYEYGKQLNNAMPEPLGEDEVKNLSVKAWRKARKIRAKQEERIHEAERAIEKTSQSVVAKKTTATKNPSRDARVLRQGGGESGDAEGQVRVEKRGGDRTGKDPSVREVSKRRDSADDRTGVSGQRTKEPRSNGSGKRKLSDSSAGEVRPNSKDPGSGDKGGVGKKKKGTLRIVEMRGEEGFKYDYSEEPLSLDRFSDSSIAQRVMQRFEGRIVRVGRSIYAFDAQRRVWVNQKGSPTLLAKYVKLCSADTIHDPRFVRELCLDRGGNLQPEIEKKWKRHFFSGSTQGRVIGILQNENDYPILQPTDFDADAELLFCANGVLNIRTGELKEVRPEDYQLFCNKIEWNPDAECPAWLQFLEDIFANNDEPHEMVDFMHEVFGYSLCGSISAQKIFVHWGSGSNGKSKLLSILSLLMGAYAARMSCNSLSKTKNGFNRDVERVTVKSEGKRLLVLDDLETKTQWDEGLVKTFTADTLPMRKLYEDEIDIPNRAKIHIGCNEPPSPEAENFGLVRRLYFISYHRKFEPNIQSDMQLNKNLRAELPGILAWAVKGYQKLASQGFLFSEPEQLKADKKEYESEHFKLTNVLLEMFEPMPKSGAVVKKMMSSDEYWYDINDLVQSVETAAEKANIYEPVSVHWLAVKLKEDFGALKRRVRKGKKRVVQYCVKFSGETKETL